MAIGRQWVNEKNINFEEWFVWRETHFSYRRTTFTAWLLVDSHSLHPHTHPSYPGAQSRSAIEEVESVINSGETDPLDVPSCVGVPHDGL
jgi:hypothetical protein